MPDLKSPLRLARERAGLSRKAMADKLGTTVHHYWHCEEPPYDGDPELMEAAWQLLGQPSQPPPTAPATTRGGSRETQRRTPTGELKWRCPRCDATQVTFAGVTAVGHRCPKTKKWVEMHPDRNDA